MFDEDELTCYSAVDSKVGAHSGGFFRLSVYLSSERELTDSEPFAKVDWLIVLDPVGLSVWLGWIAGLLDCCIAGLSDCWIAGLPDYWITGLLDYWIAGLLDCWIAGLLGCWISGFVEAGS